MQIPLQAQFDELNAPVAAAGHIAPQVKILSARIDDQGRMYIALWGFSWTKRQVRFEYRIDPIAEDHTLGLLYDLSEISPVRYGIVGTVSVGDPRDLARQLTIDLYGMQIPGVLQH